MDERALPITDHLTELRNRLSWVVGSMILGAILSFNFAEQIFSYLLAPATNALGEKGSQLQAIAPTEIFFTYIKCALLSGFVMTLPVSFPIVFEFFNGWDNEWVVSAWSMKEVFSLTTRLFLAFGVAFEMPLFVFFLAITGILSARQLLAGTPYAILIMFILGALLTPPDFVSQVFLAVPMVVLYLIGVGVAFFFEPERREAREAKKEGAAVAKRD